MRARAVFTGNVVFLYAGRAAQHNPAATTADGEKIKTIFFLFSDHFETVLHHIAFRISVIYTAAHDYF